MLTVAIIIIFGSTTYLIGSLESHIADGTINNYYDKIGVSSVAEARLLIYRPIFFTYLPWLLLTAGILGVFFKRRWGMLMLISYWISWFLFGVLFRLGCMGWHSLTPDCHLKVFDVRHLGMYHFGMLFWIGSALLLIKFCAEDRPYSFGKSLLGSKEGVYYLVSMVVLFVTTQFAYVWEVELLKRAVLL